MSFYFVSRGIGREGGPGGKANPIVHWTLMPLYCMLHNYVIYCGVF